MRTDPRLGALRETVDRLLAAAGDDPTLAERALRRLRADPKLAHLVHMPPGLKRTGRRSPAQLDPFTVAGEAGQDGLLAQLGELQLEELRDVVAQFGMDPRRLVMKWKDADRVREHIASTTAKRARKGDAFRAESSRGDVPELASLSERQQTLIDAFISAWESHARGPAHQPFELGSGPFDHPNWPDHVAPPSREEVRPLVHMGLLESDRRAAPIWRVFPSAGARRATATSADSEAALSDPDCRLGVILEATVAAYEADPAEPIHFASMEQLDYVSHPHWPLQPDVVRSHDLDQLAELGLISTRPRGKDVAFWPTLSARTATKDVADYLEKLADAAPDDAERSRLTRWSKRLRTGDFAVSAAAGTASGALIRALMGL